MSNLIRWSPYKPHRGTRYIFQKLTTISYHYPKDGFILLYPCHRKKYHLGIYLKLHLLPSLSFDPTQQLSQAKKLGHRRVSYPSHLSAHRRYHHPFRISKQPSHNLLFFAQGIKLYVTKQLKICFFNMRTLKIDSLELS